MSSILMSKIGVANLKMIVLLSMGKCKQAEFIKNTNKCIFLLLILRNKFTIHILT